MANLCITRRCRRRCGYCFARHEMDRDLPEEMSPEVYEAALAFLLRSGFPQARLLGGEPTEHSRFSEYVALAIERGLGVTVFTGGLVPKPAMDCMAALPAKNISVVLNAADPADGSEALLNQQRDVCRVLGEKVMLGVNIHSPRQDPLYLFDWVKRYGLCRRLRVGIAHPIWGGANDFFRIRGPRVISILERLVAIGADAGVDVGFDCGFTPCMFSREFVDSHIGMFTGPDVGRDAPGAPPAGPEADSAQGGEEPIGRVEAVGVRCSPVLDVLPEGDCIACYALSRFRRFPLPPDATRGDLVAAFDDALAPALPVGVHRECERCDYRTAGMCGGGCRARRASRLRPDASIPLLPTEPAVRTPVERNQCPKR